MFKILLLEVLEISPSREVLYVCIRAMFKCQERQRIEQFRLKSKKILNQNSIFSVDHGNLKHILCIDCLSSVNT